jgi:hypothetical protein
MQASHIAFQECLDTKNLYVNLEASLTMLFFSLLYNKYKWAKDALLILESAIPG